MLDATPPTLMLRPFSEQDSRHVTGLLHRAYAPLGRMGLRYWATHQSEADTCRRAAAGECIVATIGERLVGTICLRHPDPDDPTAWYAHPEVATFGQFAVEPDRQRDGIGSLLLTRIEQRAIEIGARELACDTSDHATHLIGWYTRRGYRFIGHVDHRPHTNYCSVILSKALEPDPTELTGTRAQTILAEPT